MSDNQPDAPNQDNEPSQPTKRSSADNDTSTQPSDVAPTVKADDTAISDDLDPAERDARWLRRWYPVSFVGKLALLVVSLLLAILLAIYYAVGTPWGTNLLVKAIVQQTGISLKYGEGNLRDGLWIYDLNIPSKPPTNYVEISVDKAYVKIGWRAILAKEVHLREATIGNMTITYKQPPNNKPFAYKRIALPVNLILDHATANLVRYQQVTKDPIDFKQAEVTGFSWQGSKINVKDGKLGYNDLLTVQNVKGEIDLQGDYPLDATARVVINPLTKVYFDALDTHVTGSLKFLTADINSLYNKSAVVGHITAQPMQKNAPFRGKLEWKDVQLPYATDQNIHLKNGILTASGVTNNIELRLNTDLTAKGIPDGHYQGRATTNTKKLEIEHLTATLPEGTLVSQGVIDWQNRTHIALMNTGQGFKVRNLVSQDIAPYLPETLTGKLAVVFDAATATEPMTIKANLLQKDGELINALITRPKAPNNTTPKPYHIVTNWQHLIRHNVPNVGEINSPNGSAVIDYQGAGTSKGRTQPAQLSVNGKANIIKLNIAPRGDYQFNLRKVGQNIALNRLLYKGVAGDLDGKGAILLATGRRPLTWQIDATTNRFNAHDVLDNVPLNNLKGHIKADGTLQKVRQARGVVLNRHNVRISQIDMTGDLLGSNNSKKHLLVKGSGSATVDLVANKLSFIAAKFNGSLNAPNLPSGQFKFDIAGTPKQLQINQFSHQFVSNGQTGGIDAKGKVDLTNGIGWNLTASMRHFDASYFVPSLPSRISGTINTDGYWRDGGQYIHIANMDLSGTLKNQPLTARGQLTARLNLPKDLTALKNTLQAAGQSQKVSQLRQMVEQLQADNLIIQWGNNRITANGNQNQLVTSVDISTLNQLIPQLRGIVRGGLVLTQNNQQVMPNIYVDLVARNLSLPNFVILDATIKGQLVNLARSPSQLQINATGVNIANQPIRGLQLNFNGTQAAHTLDVKIDSVRGQVQARLKGSIDLTRKQWQGLLGNGQIGTKYAKLQQLQPAQMLLNWQQPQIQLAAHCWQMAGQSGRLCLKDNLIASATQGQVNLSLQQIDSQIFSVVMPNDIAWSGTLNGNALVHWRKNQRPTVNASFYSDNGVFGTAAQMPEENPTTIAYERVSVIARSTAEGLKLRADIKTANGAGSGYLDATVDPYGANKPINGSILFQDVNLSVLKPFFPGFDRLTGNGLIAGKINGTLNQPKFVGDAEIQDATLVVTGVPIRFDNINVLAHVEGNQASINGGFTTPNDGKGKLTGTIDWQRELQAKLKLTGENLQVSQPPMLTARINPVFDVVVLPSKRYVNVVGVIDVPRAIIRPPEATAEVVTKSPDVNVIDRRLAGRLDEVLRVSKPWSINADIGVDLGDNVTFQGFGARLPLAGALNITQRGQGTMQARGAVQVAKRSKVEIFGQNLNINFAQVRFNGNIRQPSINAEAVKDVQGVQVGFRVRGDVTEPDITVFNNGGLTEQQAMNALVTGSLNNNTGQSTNSQEFRNRVTNTLAAAGLSAGLNVTRGFTNQIGRAFGLQSLTIDASGNNNDTEINITGYITPDLYIRYGVGVFNATSSLSMRYQLTRRLYIEAKAAVNNSVDLIYNWRY
jgi:autotransporter translocation and assembly factor TamB